MYDCFLVNRTDCIGMMMMMMLMMTSPIPTFILIYRMRRFENGNHSAPSFLTTCNVLSNCTQNIRHAAPRFLGLRLALSWLVCLTWLLVLSWYVNPLQARMWLEPHCRFSRDNNDHVEEFNGTYFIIVALLREIFSLQKEDW